jgi:putative phosphoesterase
MLVGILSDSHGRADRVEAALELLDAHDAELFIHLGDLGSVDVIAAMSGRNVRLVLGNCDWEETELRRACKFHGLHVDHPIGRLQVGDSTIAYTHGHLPELMDVALAEGVDWLLHGHTHLVRDERIGRTRVINPGALQRARRYTVALLDTELDALELFELPAS